MRAALFRRFGGPEVLEIAEVPDPHAGPGQVRVAVRAAGINATETKLRRGELGGDLPQCTGRDVAGVVDEVGGGVRGVAVGDRVFGVSDHGAGAAELVVSSHVAPIPPSLGFVEAAGLPVALETATRGLDALRVARDDTLLVNGAAGGVGSTAVQLAVARGARVIGTASPANHAYLRSLGAEPVEYGSGLPQRVRAISPEGVDAALDVAGHGALPDLIDLVGGADRVVTLSDFDGARRTGVRFSTGEQGRAFSALTTIGPLIEAGRFSLPIERTFPLAEIAEAHRVSEQGHVRGRLVLLMG